MTRNGIIYLAAASIGGMVIGYLSTILFSEPIHAFLFVILFGATWANTVSSIQARSQQ